MKTKLILGFAIMMVMVVLTGCYITGTDPWHDENTVYLTETVETFDSDTNDPIATFKFTQSVTTYISHNGASYKPPFYSYIGVTVYNDTPVVIWFESLSITFAPYTTFVFVNSNSMGPNGELIDVLDDNSFRIDNANIGISFVYDWSFPPSGNAIDLEASSGPTSGSGNAVSEGGAIDTESAIIIQNGKFGGE